MIKNYVNFSLQDARKELKMTQAELAAGLDISLSQYKRLEAGFVGMRDQCPRTYYLAFMGLKQEIKDKLTPTTKQ